MAYHIFSNYLFCFQKYDVTKPLFSIYTIIFTPVNQPNSMKVNLFLKTSFSTQNYTPIYFTIFSSKIETFVSLV